MFKAGMFNAQKLPELKIYVSLLDDESVMPKEKMEEAIRLIEEEQQKIAMMNAQAQLMQQRVNQFLSDDPNAQASQMNEYANQQQMNNDNQALE
jgi:DNA integrity scanning protein DisA with diadenylate cyclase activity